MFAPMSQMSMAMSHMSGMSVSMSKMSSFSEVSTRAECEPAIEKDSEAMKLKIDTTAVQFMCTKTPEPRTDFGSGQARIDKISGLPLYLVQLMALDADGGDVIAVTVIGDPKVGVGQHVSVTGLVATPWSQDGRSGVAFRADAITAADGAAKAGGQART